MLERYIADDYLRGLAILVGFFAILRIGLLIFEQIALGVTRKTKTVIDDLLIKKTMTPLAILLFLIILRIAFREVPMDLEVASVVYKTIHSLIAVVIIYLLYIIFDLIIINALKKFSSKSKIKVDSSIISLINSSLKIALIPLTILYVLHLWGVEITPLLAGLGIAGLAVALALQPVLSNILSGASLILDNSVRIGDLVYLDANTKGKIEKVGLRSTRLKTFDNELIIIPNAKLAESTIQNVALPEPKTRVVVPFSVAYGCDIEKVKKIVMKELNTIKNLAKEPTPIIRFLKMADSSLNFEAYFHVESFEDRVDAIDEANTKIYNALRKNKIEIPFPQMDVHLRK